jgi:hypothetical protein
MGSLVLKNLGLFYLQFSHNGERREMWVGWSNLVDHIAFFFNFSSYIFFSKMKLFSKNENKISQNICEIFKNGIEMEE